MKYIKAFESNDKEFNIGDYVKEFIPIFGYRYFYIKDIKKYPKVKSSPTFYIVLDLPNKKEYTYLKGYVTNNRWEISSEEEYNNYLIKKDSEKYNL